MKKETFGVSVLDILGIDPEEVEWKDFALCKTVDPSLFFEGYESSERTAKLTDQMCLSCPVRRECLQTGVEEGYWGCWGGVFLVNGKADKIKNSHKTPEVWESIRGGIDE